MWTNDTLLLSYQFLIQIYVFGTQWDGRQTLSHYLISYMKLLNDIILPIICFCKSYR